MKFLPSLYFVALFICLVAVPAFSQDAIEDYGHYTLTNQYEAENSVYHFIAQHQGSQENYKGVSAIIKDLHIILSFHDAKTFRIKFLDDKNARWEIPERVPFPHFTKEDTIPLGDSCCSVDVQSSPFNLVITRKDTAEVLFDTRDKQFIYSDLYIELSTSLPTEFVYGFGERNSPFKLTPGIHTIWGRDDARIMHHGVSGSNTYSHHPVGLMRDKKGDFFMTLMRNSNAMDVLITQEAQQPGLTYKIIGGIVDLIFFVGDKNPETVIKSYHNYLGNFTMMPFWSMGYHQSKWGYDNHQKMEEVVMKYDENNIPLDVIWSDIDYMIDKEIFTIDERRYPCEQMKELTTKHKKRWVPIIDPGARITNPQGPGTSAGMERDIFLKNKNGVNLVGSVWPGRVYFPDFFNPNMEQYWFDMFEIIYQKIPFAGIWLDMNEVANFVNGEDNRWDWSGNIYDNLPYVPGNRLLRTKTISLDAVHHGNILEYNVHGLFSIMENEATYKFLQKKSKLPFILTRSTSMGLGKFAAHWTGDNGASWDFLQVSIPGNFNFQIFGIPFVGADICGFMGDTNAELCARWTQVGALYPFARNHHELETRHQEPWTFVETNQGVTVLDTSRIAIKARYSILKWYYSLFIETRGAGTIFKPLMFEFPEDLQLYTYKTIDWQFMLGKAVLCTPKVEPGEPFINAYFPIATWFELFTGRKIIADSSAERELKVETPFNAAAPQFLRAGHIVHRQNVERVLTTNDLNDEFELIVGLGKDTITNQLSAKGSLMGVQSFDEDTIYYRCMEDNCLYDIVVTVPRIDESSATLSVKINRQNMETKVPLDQFGLTGLKLYGLPLTFLEEDERKVGYALIEFSKSSGNTIVIPDIKSLVQIEKEAFQIDFGSVIRIEDGDTLDIELLM